MIIKKDKLPKWSHELSDYKIFAPHREDDVVIFKEVKNVNKVVLHYANSVKPPKELFFPQTQELFKYEKSPELKVSEAESPSEKMPSFFL